jgi:serine/threonine-protein kinase
VYRARDVELGRDVAVKLLHAHLGGQGQAGRFFAEARVAAALRHAHIVSILDLDEEKRRIVMELCAGGTLKARVAERGALPPASALARHVEILSALGAAHRRGVVHRDLKPANLLFRREEIVLCDFGVAHLVGGAGASSKEAVGTLQYMSPEQRRGETSAASDLYAAGVILWEMLAGEAPWDQATALKGAPAELPALPAAPVAALGEEAAPAVSAHLRALTATAPQERPATAAALAEARALLDLHLAGDLPARLREERV